VATSRASAPRLSGPWFAGENRRHFFIFSAYSVGVAVTLGKLAAIVCRLRGLSFFFLSACLENGAQVRKEPHSL